MKHIGLACLGLLLCTAIALAGEAKETKIYPIPRFEAEQVIVDWLKSMGYEVNTLSRDDSIQISASLKGQEFMISLKHHSPLATKVSVEDASPKDHADALWKYLTGYLQGYSSMQGDASYNVPAPVLSRKEFVVCIRAFVQGKPIQLTGFVVDKDGLIICTAHMLQRPQTINIILSTGLKIYGRLIRVDDSKDLALIDCDYRFGDVSALNNGKTILDMGQRVFVVGCPLNHGISVSSGFVDGPPRLVESQPLLQVRMSVEPGSSGSPVFDEEGNLVALVKGRLKGNNFSGLLIPLETIVSFIKNS